MEGIQQQICPNPVFIIGCPRSGTSILAWALAQHSQFWTSVESALLFDLFGDDRATGAYETAKARPDGSDWLMHHKIGRAEFLGYLGLGLNALVTSRSQGKRWIDQTPRNSLMVDVLGDMFPGAQFLHILRDGRKVVNSMIHFGNVLGSQGQAAFAATNRMPDWATSFERACLTWRDFVYVSMNFCAKNPDRAFTVINDELVADPHRGFRAIFDFLHVPPENATAAYFQSHRINTSFKHKAQEPGWVRHFPNPWDEWTDEQRAIFKRAAGDTMLKHGLASEPEMALASDTGS